MVMAPSRRTLVGFAATANSTLPAPLPRAPAVTVIQDTFAVAVHVQASSLALTVTAPLSSVAPAALSAAPKRNVHPVGATALPKSRTVPVALVTSLLASINVAVCSPAVVGVHRIRRSRVSPAPRLSGAG